MDDLISRQAVIDAIEDDNRNGHYSCFASNNDAQCFKDVIRSLPSVKPQEPKWIPVSERLPEDEEDVLFCAFGHIMLGYHPSDWKSTHFAERGSWELQKNVEAWMPLPSPWKGEQE